MIFTERSRLTELGTAFTSMLCYIPAHAQLKSLLNQSQTLYTVLV